MALDAVRRARTLLQNVTPLAADCGRFCGAACCQGDDDTGMLLFPGEEQLYAACAFGDVRNTGYSLGGRPALLFVCRDWCAREERPLACRLFPLTVRFGQDGAPSLIMDPRSAGVCPLYASGLQGLSPSFREAALEAFEVLLDDPDCRAFLTDLQQQLTL